MDRVTECLPAQSHDAESDKFSDSGNLPPSGATTSRARPLIRERFRRGHGPRVSARAKPRLSGELYFAGNVGH